MGERATEERRKKEQDDWRERERVNSAFPTTKES